MASARDISARAEALVAQFEASGATYVEVPVLQPAETLLDLYGEDIRARAYVTSDPLRGEQMLRPDFTVPIVQMHMDAGNQPARYAYAGRVFRRQEDDLDRANEYVQVGYEVLNVEDPFAADAEVFALLSQALAGLELKVDTGDIGLLRAAVMGLETTPRRRAALLRHLWRPARFRHLLDLYSGRAPVPAAQADVLATDHIDASAAGPLLGKRGRDEVAARIAWLREDHATGALPAHQVDLIEALLNVRETLPFALENLRDIAVDMPAISDGVENLHRRAEALSNRGINTDALPFATSFGRTSMEYYDGFVFGFYVDARPDLPAVATGGRYDALTRALGGGVSCPAVGGVLRPGLMVDLEGAA